MTCNLPVSLSQPHQPPSRLDNNATPQPTFGLISFGLLFQPHAPPTTPNTHMCEGSNVESACLYNLLHCDSFSTSVLLFLFFFGYCDVT